MQKRVYPVAASFLVNLFKRAFYNEIQSAYPNKPEMVLGDVVLFVMFFVVVCIMAGVTPTDDEEDEHEAED